ncbi:MAG: chloride channel protein [Fidelibacterota bacterium]
MKSRSLKNSRILSARRIGHLRRRIALGKTLSSLFDRFLHGLKSREQLFVISAAVFIGVSGGAAAAGFRFLIDLFQSLLWGKGTFTDLVRWAPLYMKWFVPAAGGAVVAALVFRFAREAKGHGVPEVMEAVATRNGFIRMRVVAVKSVVSALCIASGGSVGREGPIAQVGSAFGSAVGQILQVSRRRMRTFVGCGAAAGIAATFNAPIAGAIFASEIILGDFSIGSIGPVMISSVLATVVTRGIYGDYPAFVPPVYVLRNPVELVFYGVLGVAAGLVALIFIKMLYSSEDLFDRIKIPVPARAAAGGLILGTIALVAPEVLGVGYESVGPVLAGEFTVLVSLMLLALKLLATSVTLGSGGSGGVFAPSLFIGAMLGSALGDVLHSLFPLVTASAGAYALVGMAAVVAATTHAPITAILIIFEMTSEYTVILPLMISSILATFVKSRLLAGSIYTLKLERKGVNIHGGRDVAVLRRLSVGRMMRKGVKSIGENETVESLLALISASSQSYFPVVNERGSLTGMVTINTIRRFLNRYEEVPSDSTVKDVCETTRSTVTTETSVDEALRIMSSEDVASLPVVGDEGQVMGQLFRSDIIGEYQELLLQEQTANSVASAMESVHRNYHELTEVIPGFYVARIDVPSRFINRTVPDLNIRRNYGVDVLLVRHPSGDGYENRIPTDRMRFVRGDQMVIFGEKGAVDRMTKLDV